jgi:hypothetical protein
MYMINKLGIDEIVDFPTRKDNILDLFCTNQPSLINKITSKKTILNYVKHNTLPVYNTDLHNIIHCI